MKNKNIHWKYLTVVFILSYIWQMVIYFTGDLDSRLFPLLMMFPAIVAIVFRIINKEGFRNVGWGLRKWWYVIPALAHAAMNLTGILLFNEFIMQQNDIILKLIFIAAWGIVAALCLISLNRKKPVLWQVSEGMGVKNQHS